MPGRRIIATALAAAAVVLALGAFTASASDPMVFDRGLPTANLNNAAGANRSNVAWSNGNTYVSGDDFTVGAIGETWVVSAIRSWTVVGGRLPGTFKIGDVFSDVSLYTGASGVSLAATGTLTSGSDATGNPNITLTPVQYVGAIDYQSTGGSLRQIYQVDVTGLNLVVTGGVKYYFAVDGTPRNTSDVWFNHGSNAALSGSTQQGADNRWLVWPKASLSSAPTLCNSNGPISGVCDGGWDKSSDINVQVFAHKQVTTPVLSVGGTTDVVAHGGFDGTAAAGQSSHSAAIAANELAAVAVTIILVAGCGWYVRRRLAARA